jgi:hypothetical protein
MKKRDRRNLMPHKPAVAAMNLWPNDYASQNGGSMDFWDTLSESRKERCRDLVANIEEARKE